MNLEWKVLAFLIGGAFAIGLFLFFIARLLFRRQIRKSDVQRIPTTHVIGWIFAGVLLVIVGAVDPRLPAILLIGLVLYGFTSFLRQSPEQRLIVYEAIVEQDQKPWMRALSAIRWGLLILLAYLVIYAIW